MDSDDLICLNGSPEVAKSHGSGCMLLEIFRVEKHIYALDRLVASVDDGTSS